jgi:hypothetical protein
MKKLAPFVAIALLIVVQTGWAQSSVDFGGTITNRTSLASASPLSFSQNNGIDFWFSTNGPYADFLMQGAYSFTYDQSADPTIQHLPDVQSLRLNGNVPTNNMGMSRFTYSLGRFPLQDHTRNVLSQAVDGFKMGFQYPNVSVTTAFGTSILPNKKSGAIMLSKADITDYNDEAVLMGSPRVVGLLEVAFPNVFRQRLTLSGVIQEDLRPLLADRSVGLIQEGETEERPSVGGVVDTQHIGLGVKGNIVSTLFYDVHFTVGAGRTLSYITPEGSVAGSYAYIPLLSAMGGAGLNLYLPQFLNSVAGISFVLSTGDTWSERGSYTENSSASTSMLFLPVTSKPLAMVFAPSLGNIMAATASYSLRPFGWLGSPALDQLQIALKGISFIRYAAGPLSVAVPNPDSLDAYLGTELDLQISFRPLSDLGFTFAGGLFFPNTATGAPFDSTEVTSPQMKMQVTASFSF